MEGWRRGLGSSMTTVVALGSPRLMIYTGVVISRSSLGTTRMLSMASLLSVERCTSFGGLVRADPGFGFWAVTLPPGAVMLPTRGVTFSPSTRNSGAVSVPRNGTGPASAVFSTSGISLGLGDIVSLSTVGDAQSAE
eukprot:1942043-Pyramimonas_sp.AAC.1